MTCKQHFRKHLIQSYHLLRLYHQKNAPPFKLELPKKLETTKELVDFSNKMDSHIKHNITIPEFYIYS